MRDELHLRLVEMLHARIVTFSYLKKDGTKRIAKGTLNRTYCPPIKGGGKPTPRHLQLYFDLDKNAWRCFTIDNLLKIEDYE